MTYYSGEDFRRSTHRWLNNSTPMSWDRQTSGHRCHCHCAPRSRPSLCSEQKTRHYRNAWMEERKERMVYSEDRNAGGLEAVSSCGGWGRWTWALVEPRWIGGLSRRRRTIGFKCAHVGHGQWMNTMHTIYNNAQTTTRRQRYGRAKRLSIKAISTIEERMAEAVFPSSFRRSITSQDDAN